MPLCSQKRRSSIATIACFIQGRDVVGRRRACGSRSRAAPQHGASVARVDDAVPLGLLDARRVELAGSPRDRPHEAEAERDRAEQQQHGEETEEAKLANPPPSRRARRTVCPSRTARGDMVAPTRASDQPAAAAITASTSSP